MRMRVGIAVAADAVRAVAVNRMRAVIWHAEEPRGTPDDDALRVAIVSLLRRLRRNRFVKPLTIVALGPHCTQVRLLSELPPLGDAKALARVVREGASRFFLKNGAPLVTGGVRVVDDRSAWAAAYDLRTIHAVRTACREGRARLGAYVPCIAVLPAGLIDQSLAWADGDVAMAIRFEGRCLASASRVPRLADNGCDYRPPTPRPPLVSLGEDGWRFADAYGAAVAGDREPIGIRATELRRPEGDIPPWHLSLAYTIAAVAVIAAALAPGLSARRAERVAEAELREMAVGRQSVAIVARELARVTGALEEGMLFVRHRRSHLSLLASLTDGLPADASIAALKTDTAGGHLIVLASRAAAALAAIDSVREIAGAEILGPVTREIIGTREVERATIKFRWSESIVQPSSSVAGASGGATLGRSRSVVSTNRLPAGPWVP